MYILRQYIDSRIARRRATMIRPINVLSHPSVQWFCQSTRGRDKRNHPTLCLCNVWGVFGKPNSYKQIYKHM